MMIVSLLQLGHHSLIQWVSRLGSVCVSLLGCRKLEYEAVVVFDKARFGHFIYVVSKIESANKLLKTKAFTRGLYCSLLCSWV